MSRYEPVLQLHPVIHAAKGGLILFDAVEEATKGGDTKDEFLLVHVAGVFVLSQRSFTKQFQIVKFIPLFDLSKLVVMKKELTFVSEKVTFSIRHQKHLKIAAKCAAVHHILFDHPNISLEVEVDEGIRNQYEQQFFDFHSDSLLADRFVACVLRLPIQFNESLVKETYETLSAAKSHINVTAELAANPYISAICAAISFDFEIKSICLKNVSFAFFSQYFTVIAKNSLSCERVIMKNVDFTQQIKHLEDLFNENQAIVAKEFEFKRCNFISATSGQFFEAFAKYPADVINLTFEESQFSTSSLDSLFQSLFFSSCFHNLEGIYISGVSQVSELPLLVFQLVSCGWVLEKHCLHTLAILSSALKLETLLPQILKLDSGFENLDLSGNYISTPFSMKYPISFQHITNFILSKGIFGNGALLSLLRLLSKHDKFFSLDLSEAKMDESSWEDFYSNVESIKISKLTSLVWDLNEIDETTSVPFTDFLKLQPALKEISISRCVSKLERGAVLPTLIELVNAKAFESFRMNANFESALGPALSPLILSLIRNGMIKSLEISGQAIGEKCIMSIAKEMPSTLVELNFDGFSPSSADTFLSVCESFLDRSWLRNVVWPATDVKPSIARSPSQFRNEMTRRIQHMRSQYAVRFGENYDSHPKISEKRSQIDNVEKMGISLNKGYVFENITTMSNFAKYDEETLDLLKECEMVSGTEPINKTLSGIDEHTQIPELQAVIASLDESDPK